MIEKQAAEKKERESVKSSVVKTQELVSNLANKLPEDRVLRFDDELFENKDLYETMEDKLNKAFQHRSKAACQYCKQPLFHPLKQEPTKSIGCGKKFHIVSFG